MTGIGYTEALEQAAAYIRGNDDFLVVSHIQPDGDAAGSTFAVAWMLEQLGKRFTLINEGRMPDKFMFMAGHHPVVNLEMNPPERMFERIISVDCADAERMGRVRTCFAPDYQLLNIDHHATNDHFGITNLVQDQAAATVEVLYDLAKTLHLTMSNELAVCIYSGLLTDTGGFRYSNASPKVLRIAAELLELGVSGHELAERLLEKMTYAQISLLKESLKTLSFAYDRKVAWLTVTLAELASTGASSEDLDGLVNYARNVEGVELGILFKEKAPDLIKVSLRSGGRIDVARLAQKFGGGGHVRAAGCSIQGTLEEAIARIVQAAGGASL